MAHDQNGKEKEVIAPKKNENRTLYSNSARLHTNLKVVGLDVCFKELTP
jgi:hypothetical protein